MAEEELPQGESTGETEIDQGPDLEGYSQFVAGVLKDVPEEHRAILEPYVQKWDAGVSRRFQDLHGELNPYRELGELEDLQQMAQIIDVLNNDPERIYQALKEQLYPDEKQNPPAAPAEVPGIPTEYLDRINKVDSLEQTLQQIAEMLVANNTAQQQAQEDQELDQYMSRLHTEYGKFDDHYVLTKMYNGMAADDAIQDWNAMISQHIENAMAEHNGAPPVLSSQGGSAVPMETQNLGKIPGKDLVRFIAETMAQAKQQGS